MLAGGLYRDCRDLHVRAVRESSLSFAEKLDGTVATLACFRARFGLDSVLIKLLQAGARVTRQRARLDRRFGISA